MNRTATPTAGLQGRSSGILLHVTSLPNAYGIGDLGPAAYRWIEMLAQAKQRWWQILPLGPPGAGNSPYQCYSAFAGNPLLISGELLLEEGLVDRDELQNSELGAGPVNYPRAIRSKLKLLHQAWGRARQQTPAAFDAFVADETNRAWLDDYALFAALSETRLGNELPRWPKSIRTRQPGAIASAKTEFADEIRRHAFWQFLFDQQLQRLRDHARDHGVGIIGDIPIFISANSSDLWANPQLFEVDRSLRPVAVAGVPPDCFCVDGQRWGNPHYNWPAMQRDGFAWWRGRVRATLRQCDIARLDHFRGLESYWRIPARALTAATGKWVKAPGAALLMAIRDDLGGLPLIAEDLGMITPEVEKLRDDFGLPSMRILQFAFDGDASNPHLPHNYSPNCVAYTGTHDNDTARGWHRSASRQQRRRLLRYAGVDGGDTPFAMIRLAWTSVARLAITQAQDLLALPRSARMNTPGTPAGNWRWRLRDFASLAPAMERLADLTDVAGSARR
jgi:4-alpha-glucanotransferase